MSQISYLWVQCNANHMKWGECAVETALQGAFSLWLLGLGAGVVDIWYSWVWGEPYIAGGDAEIVLQKTYMGAAQGDLWQRQNIRGHSAPGSIRWKWDPLNLPGSQAPWVAHFVECIADFCVFLARFLHLSICKMEQETSWVHLHASFQSVQCLLLLTNTIRPHKCHIPILTRINMGERTCRRDSPNLTVVSHSDDRLAINELNPRD